MAPSKSYTVLFDGKPIYSGPIRSAQLVLNAIQSIDPMVPELANHQLLLAFGKVRELPDPNQTTIL